jgi:hypothetical protein
MIALSPGILFPFISTFIPTISSAIGEGSTFPGSTLTMFLRSQGRSAIVSFVSDDANLLIPAALTSRTFSGRSSDLKSRVKAAVHLG